MTAVSETYYDSSKHQEVISILSNSFNRRDCEWLPNENLVLKSTMRSKFPIEITAAILGRSIHEVQRHWKELNSLSLGVFPHQ